MSRTKRKPSEILDVLGGRKPGGEEDLGLDFNNDEDETEESEWSAAGGWEDEPEDESDTPADPKRRPKESRATVDEAIAVRRAREKAVLDRLDMGFFFSVVFRTRKERDAWLIKYGLTLRADDYVTVDDLEEGISSVK